MNQKGKSKRKKRSTVKKPPWLELPEEIWVNILVHKLGAIEILRTAEKVCTTWSRICKDPSMWRVIDMSNDGYDLHDVLYNLVDMCYHAVDRSQGELVDINLEFFANNRLLKYIAERSGKLKRLRIAYCYLRVYKCWVEVVQKLPLLEELSLTHTTIEPGDIETLGRSCPKLKSFGLNKSFKVDFYADDNRKNQEARTIAEHLPALHHLQLMGNSMTENGLEAILNGCPHLVSLDLRQCNNVSLNVDLNCRISQQIKDFKHPDDSLNGLEFSFGYKDASDEYLMFHDTSDDDSLDSLEFLSESEDGSDEYHMLGDTDDNSDF